MSCFPDLTWPSCNPDESKGIYECSDARAAQENCCLSAQTTDKIRSNCPAGYKSNPANDEWCTDSQGIIHDSVYRHKCERIVCPNQLDPLTNCTTCLNKELDPESSCTQCINPDDMRLCGDENPTCVNIQDDPLNCGGCGEACNVDAGQECGAGMCTCSLKSDNNHCGVKKEICRDGYKCSGGYCTLSCQEGLTPCGTPAVCTNTQTDRFNCGLLSDGACGAACEKGKVCSGGQCVTECTICDGACTDYDTDPLHCGGCGNDVSPFSCAGGKLKAVPDAPKCSICRAKGTPGSSGCAVAPSCQVDAATNCCPSDSQQQLVGLTGNLILDYAGSLYTGYYNPQSATTTLTIGASTNTTAYVFDLGIKTTSPLFAVPPRGGGNGQGIMVYPFQDLDSVGIGLFQMAGKIQAAVFRIACDYGACSPFTFPVISLATSGANPIQQNFCFNNIVFVSRKDAGIDVVLDISRQAKEPNTALMYRSGSTKSFYNLTFPGFVFSTPTTVQSFKNSTVVEKTNSASGQLYCSTYDATNGHQVCSLTVNIQPQLPRQDYQSLRSDFAVTFSAITPLMTNLPGPVQAVAADGRGNVYAVSSSVLYYYTNRDAKTYFINISPDAALYGVGTQSSSTQTIQENLFISTAGAQFPQIQKYKLGQ
jgi:hypothetical protein